MARCVYCGEETELYSFEMPLCVKCDDAHSKKPVAPDALGDSRGLGTNATEDRFQPEESLRR
jgi:hypothetical protein